MGEAGETGTGRSGGKPAGKPEELRRQVLSTQKCLEFELIHWRDTYGTERIWETVERINRRDAVMTIPWLRPSNRLVLIRQYRPPAKGDVIEFPAGLVDDGETPEAAAVRELKEETGYVGTVASVIPPTFNTPGLSGEAVYQIVLEVNEQLPENLAPETAFDDGEFIEVVTVPWKGFATFLGDEIKAGSRFDSKVMAYMAGMISQAELVKQEASKGDWLSRLFRHA